MIFSRRIVSMVGRLLVLDYTMPFSFALTGQQITADLQSQLSNGSEIIYTSQAAYDSNFAPRYSITAPPTYQIAVKPAVVDDVQKIVSYAKTVVTGK